VLEAVVHYHSVKVLDMYFIQILVEFGWNISIIICRYRSLHKLEWLQNLLPIWLFLLQADCAQHAPKKCQREEDTRNWSLWIFFLWISRNILTFWYIPQYPNYSNDTQGKVFLEKIAFTERNKSEKAQIWPQKIGTGDVKQVIFISL
jgi:hypothetical protein